MNPYMTKPKISHPINVPSELIKDLLTNSEWRMVQQRLLIIQLLKQGLSIRAVALRAKVGTDTVVRMSRKLENSPLLKKTSQKLNQAFDSSKWVFGQISSKE